MVEITKEQAELMSRAFAPDNLPQLTLVQTLLVKGVYKTSHYIDRTKRFWRYVKKEFTLTDDLLKWRYTLDREALFLDTHFINFMETLKGHINQKKLSLQQQLVTIDSMLQTIRTMFPSPISVEPTDFI